MDGWRKRRFRKGSKRTRHESDGQRSSDERVHERRANVLFLSNVWKWDERMEDGSRVRPRIVFPWHSADGSRSRGRRLGFVSTFLCAYSKNQKSSRFQRWTEKARIRTPSNEERMRANDERCLSKRIFPRKAIAFSRTQDEKSRSRERCATLDRAPTFAFVPTRIVFV